MVGVITGDVVNSQSKPPRDWLKKIKLTLKRNKIPPGLGLSVTET